MEFEFGILKNGLRLLHLPAAGPVAHIGLFINAGSRDEDSMENGLAHFIEHTIFKGTAKRRAYHILTRLESVGGDLNAYTTKEETCVYASFLNEHFERAMELISDIVNNSTFPEKELKKEKEVIQDEINSYKDAPAEEIYDIFEENLFKGHPLGMNILGTPEHLQSFNRDQIFLFLKEYYLAENMVLCSVGNMGIDKMKKLATKYFEQIPSGTLSRKREAFSSYQPFRKEMERSTFQTHCIIGASAYDRNHPNKFTMILLNNLLGGPALNSRLNLSVREKHGYTYSIESAYVSYTDSGVFSIYLGMDNGYLQKAEALILKELEKLRREKLGTMQLQLARKQLIGQVAISNESNLNRMLSAGKAYLHDNQVKTIEELVKNIEAVTAGQILEVAGEIFDPAGLSSLVFKNNEK